MTEDVTVEELLLDAELRMESTIEFLQYDLRAIRTGRASPALVERLNVEYYGAPTPLQQLANISVPDAQTIMIRPYTPGDIATIERAIALSDLGLAPSNDGQQIRLSIPPLTGERRTELAKDVGKRAEDARVAVRNVRRDDINKLRAMEKKSLISEDELHRAQDKMQETTDAYIKQVDQIAKEKEDEIMTL